jgi:hypothetical protein
MAATQCAGRKTDQGRRWADRSEDRLAPHLPLVLFKLISVAEHAPRMERHFPEKNN